MNEPNIDYIIKPCPFCGEINIQIDKCTSRVRCKSCFATSGIISKLINQDISEKDAPIIAWNTRSYENAEND